MIMTIKGETSIENLRPGDRVLTRDSGFQPVAWVGARRFNPEKERPICLPRGFSADFATDRDVLLSPRHRVLRLDGRSTACQQREETLVEAKNIAMAAPARLLSLYPSFYVHVLFEQHQVICADGVWVESLRPTKEMIDGLSVENHQTMVAQLPKIATLSGTDYKPARMLAA